MGEDSRCRLIKLWSADICNVSPSCNFVEKAEYSLVYDVRTWVSHGLNEELKDVNRNLHLTALALETLVSTIKEEVKYIQLIWSCFLFSFHSLLDFFYFLCSLPNVFVLFLFLFLWFPYYHRQIVTSSQSASSLERRAFISRIHLRHEMLADDTILIFCKPFHSYILKSPLANFFHHNSEKIGPNSSNCYNYMVHHYRQFSREVAIPSNSKSSLAFSYRKPLSEWLIS